MQEAKHTELVIAFIDPIISPVYLTAELHRYPIKLVAVFTLMQLSDEEKRIRFHPELFDHVIYVDENKDPNDHIISVAKKLKELAVQYVFYGYESSVYFADKVSQLVCSAYANDANTSKKRFNKYEMLEALRGSNIQSIKQLKATNKSLTASQINELKTWDFPVIVKPTNSSASIGVKECNSIGEILSFIKETEHVLLDATIAQDFVIQELITGIEYIIDTISLAGKHGLASIQRYEKISYNSYPIYRYLEVMDPNSPEWKVCHEYVFPVLDAIGLKNGFGHTELFLTKNGPRLIEVNPRISGAAGFINKLAEKTLHTNQPKVLVEELTSKTYTVPSTLFQHGRCVFLQNWQARKMGNLNVELLKSLPSYTEHLMLKNTGHDLQSPQNLLDTVGFVLLVNPDKNQLLADYAKLIAWEKDHVLF